MSIHPSSPRGPHPSCPAIAGKGTALLRGGRGAGGDATQVMKTEFGYELVRVISGFESIRSSLVTVFNGNEAESQTPSPPPFGRSPSPAIAGADMRSRSRDASASEPRTKIRKNSLQLSGEQDVFPCFAFISWRKREAERRQAHHPLAASCGCGSGLSRDRSPLGAPPRRLPRKSMPWLSPGRVSCDLRNGGRLDARTARERSYKPRPREPHSPHQSAVTGDVPDERDGFVSN
jgi:hypothetical protein